MREVWRQWGRHGWNAESFALGWFLCLGYKAEVARAAVDDATRSSQTTRKVHHEEDR